LYTYPDIVVVCGDPRFTDDEFDTLANPTLIVEVLSPSTSDYDRGRKFEHYRTLPSLKEYLTIAQDAPHVEHWTAQAENRWLLAEFTDLAQTAQLASIDCVLPLAEIYDRIDFGAQQRPQFDGPFRILNDNGKASSPQP
jgi:Uma2 family endonuclease